MARPTVQETLPVWTQLDALVLCVSGMKESLGAMKGEEDVGIKVEGLGGFDVGEGSDSGSR